MKIREAFFIYLAALSTEVGLIFILFKINTIDAGVMFWPHIIFGCILNRLVLRNLISWHPVNATIHNMVWTKIKAIIFWPLSYPILFAKLIIVREL